MSPPSERTATVSVFVGASVDGFIARPDGGLDFLEAGDGSETGESTGHGYEEFIADIDAIVMGRNTFDTVLGFKSWPYGKRRVIVLSRRALDLSGVQGTVEQMSGEPAEIVRQLAARGFRHLYVDGGLTIQGFLRAGQVDRLIVSRVPVLIGQGIPLFGELPADLRLRHVATRTYPGGMVQTEYHVMRTAG